MYNRRDIEKLERNCSNSPIVKTQLLLNVVRSGDVRPEIWQDSLNDVARADAGLKTIDEGVEGVG
jgi:hypothetical protein